MTQTLGQKLKRIRNLTPNLTQSAVGLSIGVSKTAVGQWERDETTPTDQNLKDLARYYGVTVDSILSMPDPEPVSAMISRLAEPVVASTASRAPEKDIQSWDFVRDVPVVGIAVGGADGDFQFNGETIDYAKRTPPIMSQRDVFAVRISGESMWPRLKDGELVYVSQKRQPAIGDDVIIEMLPTEEGAAGAAFVKMLVKRTATKVVCQQFNPPKQIEYDLKAVGQVLRIIPTSELLGN